MIYIIIFFTSTPFQTIYRFDGIFDKFYSNSEFIDMWTSLSKANPQVQLRVNSANDTHGCQSIIYSYQSDNSINVKDKPNKIKFDDYLLGKKGIALVDLSVSVTFTEESEMKLKKLINRMKNCPKNVQYLNKVGQINTIDGMISSIIVSKNGKIPRKFQKKWVILEGIFWAGARLGFDLTAFPIIYENVIKTNVSFLGLLSFDCNQLKMSCWPASRSKQCAIDDTKPKENLHITSENENSELTRDRLSRAYYLSDATYSADFSQYEEPSEGKKYVWKKPLVDQWIYQESRNGYAFPPFFVGKHENEIWIAVRGSHTLIDWVTDITAYTSNMFKGRYHKGFYQAGVNIWPRVSDIIKEYSDGNYNFIFTGHSYGGAVANILHRLASYCFPDLRNSMHSVTFGAPPAMSELTAIDISPRIHSFINGNDPVPCLSTGNIKKFGEDALLALLTINQKESDSERIKKSVMMTFDAIDTLFYQNDPVDKPLGKVYHSDWKPWKKHSKKKIETIKETSYKKIAKIHLMFTHHRIKNYGKTFSSYKNGILKPNEFDREATIIPIKKTRINQTILEAFNFEYIPFYDNYTLS